MENTQQNVTIIWMNDFCFNSKTKIIEMLSQYSTLKISAIILIFRVFAHIATTQRSRSLGMATTRKLRIIANILIIKLRQHFNRRQSRILKQNHLKNLPTFTIIFSPHLHTIGLRYSNRRFITEVETGK